MILRSASSGKVATWPDWILAGAQLRHEPSCFALARQDTSNVSPSPSMVPTTSMT